VFMWRDSNKDWTVNISNGHGFDAAIWQGDWGSDGPIFVGDLNGDGKTDVFMWRDSNKDWTVNISNGHGFDAAIWQGAWGSDGPINVGDLNGDGKTDVFMWRGDTWTVNLSTGSNWAPAEWDGFPGTGCVLGGDFNGDHRIDVAMYHPETDNFSVNISTVSGWFAETWPKPHGPPGGGGGGTGGTGGTGGGGCGRGCTNGAICCGNRCVFNDSHNCGACGNACQFGEVCQGQKCQSTPPACAQSDQACVPDRQPGTHCCQSPSPQICLFEICRVCIAHGQVCPTRSRQICCSPDDQCVLDPSDGQVKCGLPDCRGPDCPK
jgi:hypothetical protein